MNHRPDNSPRISPSVADFAAATLRAIERSKADRARTAARQLALEPTRPIGRMQPAGASPPPDLDDVAAAEEAAEWAYIRALIGDSGARLRRAPGPPSVDELRLEVVARMAVYEGLAATCRAEPDRAELVRARAALQAAIDRLVIEARSKVALERTVARLWKEHAVLERELGVLVPEGRMHEVVIERLRRAEGDHGR